MLKLLQVGLVCSLVSFVIGCGPSAPSQPSEDKVKDLNAQMDADMKAMTQQLPKSPGKGK